MSGAADKGIDGRDPASWGLTRAELLRRGAAGALVIGAGGLLGGEAASGAVAQALAPPKRGGTLRVGIAGGSPTDDFDMAHVNGPSATVRAQVFYETRPVPRRTVQAARRLPLPRVHAERTAGNVWTVRLKQGVEFHNGKTATAEDLLFSIKRLLNPKSGATAAGQLTAIDLEAAQEARHVHGRFVLKTPQSFFDYLLSDIVYVVPVGYDPKKPVSTGPVGVQELQARAADRARAVRELPRARPPTPTSSILTELPTTRHA